MSNRFQVFGKGATFLLVLVAGLFNGAQAMAAGGGFYSEDVQRPCYDVSGATKRVLANMNFQIDPNGKVPNSGSFNFGKDLAGQVVQGTDVEPQANLQYRYELCVRDEGPNHPASIPRYHLDGYAWNSNLGYVSFYCNNNPDSNLAPLPMGGHFVGAEGTNMGLTCGQFAYYVGVDPISGSLSGFAWGDGTGWIKFDNGDKSHVVYGPNEQCGNQVYGADNNVWNCLAHSEKDTFAWSDNVQWLDFNGMVFPKIPELEQAPICAVADFDDNINLPCYCQTHADEVPTCTDWCSLHPDICVDPNQDPNANPNGGGTGISVMATVLARNNDNIEVAALKKDPLTTPVADGSDFYTLRLVFSNENGFANITGDHLVVVPHWDDTVRLDQVDQNSALAFGNNNNCANNNGAVIKNCDTGNPANVGFGLEYTIKSKAPTSNMNGPDDGNGNVVASNEDFFLPAALRTSLPDNHLRLLSLDVSLKDGTDTNCLLAGASNDCWVTVFPNFAFGGVDFKFVPGTEVTQFENNGKTFIDNAPATPFQLQFTTKGNGTIDLYSGIDVPPSNLRFSILGPVPGVNDTPFGQKILNQSANIFAGGVLDVEVAVTANPSSNSAQGIYVYSVVHDGDATYYSNKLPRVTGSVAEQPYIILQGNIYSKGAVQVTTATSPVRSLGEIGTNVLRDQIYSTVLGIPGRKDQQAFASTNIFDQLVAPQNGFTTVSSGDFDQSVNNASSKAFLLDETNKYKALFVKGNVYLDGGVNGFQWSGDRTLVVYDGNVFINSNLVPNGAGQLGIIVLRDLAKSPIRKNTGHVYLDADVQNITANVYADGSLMPYSKNAGVFPAGVRGEPDFVSPENAKAILGKKQLLWKGSLASQNTIGGSVNNPKRLGDGQTTNNVVQARLYDLNYLRYYGGVLKRDANGNVVHSNGSAIGNGKIRDLTPDTRVPWAHVLKVAGQFGDFFAPWELDASFKSAFDLTGSCAGVQVTPLLSSAPCYNAAANLGAVYIQFQPPSKSLPGFSFSAGGTSKNIIQ